MNTLQVSIDELRTNLADLINRVMYGGDQVVVKKYKRDAAIIINKGEYEKLKDPTKRLSRTQWRNTFKSIERIQTKIPAFAETDLDRAIQESIREVRAQKKSEKNP